MTAETIITLAGMLAGFIGQAMWFSFSIGKKTAEVHGDIMELGATLNGQIEVLKTTAKNSEKDRLAIWEHVDDHSKTLSRHGENIAALGSKMK